MEFDPVSLIIWKWAKTTTNCGLARKTAWMLGEQSEDEGALYGDHAASKWRHAARDYGAGYLPSPNV